MKQSGALIVKRQLILIGGARAVERLENHIETMQPSAKIRRSLGVPTAIRQHVERAAKGSMPIFVPAAQFHRHARAESPEGFTELVGSVRGYPGDADQPLIDKGCSCEADRLGRSGAARDEQDHRGIGSEAHPYPEPVRWAIANGTLLCAHLYLSLSVCLLLSGKRWRLSLIASEKPVLGRRSGAIGSTAAVASLNLAGVRRQDYYSKARVDAERCEIRRPRRVYS